MEVDIQVDDYESDYEYTYDDFIFNCEICTKKDSSRKRKNIQPFKIFKKMKKLKISLRT